MLSLEGGGAQVAAFNGDPASLARDNMIGIIIDVNDNDCGLPLRASNYMNENIQDPTKFSQ